MKKRILVAVVFTAVIGFCALQKVQARGKWGPMGDRDIIMRYPIFEKSIGLYRYNLEELQAMREEVAALAQDLSAECSLKQASGVLATNSIRVKGACRDAGYANERLQQIDAKIAEEWNRIKGIK